MFVLRRAVVNAIVNVRAKHTLPELPYPYEALEPVISRDIMCFHHQKHHQAYVNNLNAAEDKMKCAVEAGDACAMITIAQTLKFNGGGHINHSIFWQNLTPSSCKPSVKFCDAIKHSFGDIENLRAQLAATAVGIEGSGWAWLGYDPKYGCLRLAKCCNQDPLQPLTGLIPLLGIDVWEHAYYLQYQNKRPDYVKAIWDIINWTDVSDRYEKVAGCSPSTK